MMLKKKALLLSLLLFFTIGAQAEKTDGEKPINIEADRVSVDDIKKIQIFEGNVVMTQGTRLMRTDKLVVTQDEAGFQKGEATGGPRGLAYFRQKRDDSDDYIEGEGEKIIHNARTEETEFFVRAWVKNGDDEVRGAYISFNGLTEQYSAHNSGTKTNRSSGRPDRVWVRITPSKKDEAATPAKPSDPPLKLKPSRSTVPQRDEPPELPELSEGHKTSQ